MKIGLIQTQRLGDLIIVLPVAQYFLRQGHRVFWPVSARLIDCLRQSAPGIEFLPVDPALEAADPVDYLYKTPLALLRDLGCERIHTLYTHVEGDGIPDRKLAGSLKFDEYKYAVARVPFAEKWKLRLRRDPAREQALYASLDIAGDYILVHSEGSNLSLDLTLPEPWRDRYRIIPMSALTDNPFDWIYTIEHASKRVMIDSSFANVTEQLNLGGDNYLVLRNLIQATPVYRNGWKFCWPLSPIVERRSLP